MKKAKDYGSFSIVDQDVKAFCKRHELKIKKEKCINCGEEILLNKPFYCSGYVGLSPDTCKCGFTSHIGTAKPYSKEAKAFWEKINNSYLGK